MLADCFSCTGCGACAAICPVNCISMDEKYGGFKYPVIDEKRCLNCNQCEKSCPVLNGTWLASESTYAVGVQNKDDSVRRISTAGGFVGLICDEIFRNKGVVYAACYDSDNNVYFDRLTTRDECIKKRMFGSKYVSSELNNSFGNILNDLRNGLYVCFVGLPCQVSGLKHFLRKEYNRLLLIDLTCYGAPSPKLYREYLNYCEQEYRDKVVAVNFRDKTFGYSVPSMSVEFASGKTRGQNSIIKSFLRTYFSNLSCRDSCYKCKFKGVNRESDFTIGDCKAIGKYNRAMDDDKGTTVVYVHSAKGENILKKMKDNMIATDLPLEDILKTCGVKMTSSMEENINRNKFFEDMEIMTYDDLINKYCPASLEERLTNIFKQTLLITGLNKTGIMKKLKGR